MIVLWDNDYTEQEHLYQKRDQCWHTVALGFFEKQDTYWLNVNLASNTCFNTNF